MDKSVDRNLNEFSKSNGYSSVKKHKKSNKEHFDDPELQAEAHYAQKNGEPAPVKKHFSAEDTKDNALKFWSRSKSTSDLKAKSAAKPTKNCRADRKARSRGVSGSYSKKDGGKFDYGLNDYQDQEELDTSELDENVCLPEDYIDYVYSFDVEKVHGALNEYFNNGSVECALTELTSFLYDRESRLRLTKEVIRCSLDYDQGRVVLGYKLLAELLDGERVSERDVLTAIEDLLNELDAIIQDMPKARIFLATFIAKLIVDGLLLLKDFDEITNRVDHNRQAMSCAFEVCMYLNNKALLKGKFEEHGGQAPLEVLRDQMEKILREFLLSGDHDEVADRLIQLHAPHFHHELVYLVGFYAMDRMHDAIMVKLAGLLKHLLDAGCLLESCIEPGFLRLYKELPELVIDIPAAYSLCKIWAEKCLKCGVITDDIVSQIPKTGKRRARTLSETADGKFCVDDSGEGVEVA